CAHPDWTENDINWLLDMAAGNRAAGILRFCKISEQSGGPSALFCYYSRPNGMAEVLNVVAKAGAEKPAVEAMLLHLQEEGHIAA
ncbi:hypothetical protein, partial [Burkholderia sp. SIMBA_024]